jgi:hypothetical protein
LGRQALWEPLFGDRKTLEPQFLIAMNFATQHDISLSTRAAFCDVSGHANERTVLASVIPAMAICGNKVPVCTFEPDDERLPLLWAAIANSFVVDWIIRRWVSTTINYFYWWNVPFPRLHADSPAAQRLIGAAAKLLSGLPGSESDSLLHRSAPPSLREREALRADIDATVAELFEVTPEEFELMLSDFPLLDRYQPKVEGGSQFITKDLAMLNLLHLRRAGRSETGFLERRVRLSQEVGAVGYVPSEHARLSLRPPEAVGSPNSVRNR